MSSLEPKILMMGQTPPPWHGQAVATQILFDHQWPGFEVHRLRMEFSEEMVEVGRFQWKKLRHLVQLITRARAILSENPGTVLFYPPASAKWVPFLRDVIFLSAVRPLAHSTVFIFHASGLPVFVNAGFLRRAFGRLAYRNAAFALEVAQEDLPPHEAFHAKSWLWCPCAIDVPELTKRRRAEGTPLIALFVGSLQEGKGVLEILKTASLLKKSGRAGDFRFRIVGKWFSPEFERDVRHLVEELSVEEMISFDGQLTGDAKWQAYADSDVFFFPTHYASEATPIVLMEALGMGLPIVSTRWAGIPAMLEGCGTACLLPIKSPESYASALEDIFRSGHTQEQTEQTSRNFYRQHFLPDRFVERVAKAFESALQMDGLVPNPSDEANPRPLKDRSDANDTIHVSAYLADQNPGYDRSFGISRMSQVVLDALQTEGNISIEAIASRTSQQAPESISSTRTLPWGTRRKWVRLLTDHFHPLFGRKDALPDLHYFPKGYLPLLNSYCSPSVVTIHDTIIQYDEDHYPKWRKRWEYKYWALMLKHTLRSANRILTVSESSRAQIHAFMSRHRIPGKPITVTYEPCLYEGVPQPENHPKEDYVIHLASCEPHKRTAHLIQWWKDAETRGRELPTLHLIGAVPPEAAPLLTTASKIVKRPFLEDSALLDAYLKARALILPSEIEGFGLPALEAYYLGTPVCFVRGTSVEEILSVATARGGFSLASSESLFSALDDVMTMTPEEIRNCGLKLRETYAARKVAQRMIHVFEEVKNTYSAP
jgi:glycosyltransferase involved in cell wall biosynthesis